jgi:hypothetical protein
VPIVDLVGLGGGAGRGGSPGLACRVLLLRLVRRGAGSADGLMEGGAAVERCGQAPRPRARAVPFQAEPKLTAAADQTAGDVQKPVAQGLRLGRGQVRLVVQEDRLGQQSRSTASMTAVSQAALTEKVRDGKRAGRTSWRVRPASVATSSLQSSAERTASMRPRCAGWPAPWTCRWRICWRRRAPKLTRRAALRAPRCARRTRCRWRRGHPHPSPAGG